MLHNVILKCSVTRIIILTKSDDIDGNLSVRKTAFWDMRMCNLIFMFVIFYDRYNNKMLVIYNINLDII